MIIAEMDWAIFTLATFIAIIIVAIVCWLGKNPKEHDDTAQDFGGIVGLFLYRLCGRLFTKKDKNKGEEEMVIKRKKGRKEYDG